MVKASNGGPAAVPSGTSETKTASKEAATTSDQEAVVQSIDVDAIPSNLSTAALEAKLKQFKEESTQHSQVLTQRLAMSESGQELLHMGSSLATLPPDLHSLLTLLHPVLTETESCEKELATQLTDLVDTARQIRLLQRRRQDALDCADLYADLTAAEDKIRIEQEVMEERKGKNKSSRSKTIGEDDLDQAASMERAAHITLCLVEELQSATETVTALTRRGQRHASTTSTTSAEGDDSSSTNPSSLPSMRTPLEGDTERAQFLLKLAPRIRRLEADTITCASQRMEQVLGQWQQLQEHQQRQRPQGEESSSPNHHSDDDNKTSDILLLMMSHCMRALALLGRGKEVESLFARVAILPLIRSRLSMGRLDQGGSRGECAGFTSLLDDMVTSMATIYGPIVRSAEAMFAVDDDTAGSIKEKVQKMDIDLLTCGVWVPIVTALMADAGIKMAIFSPGIASILQANYMTLDRFLANLSERMLKTSDSASSMAAAGVGEGSELVLLRPTISPQRIQQAQQRIYAHSMTSQFSKKWNLPIYYQLRFGDCCSRLNKAIELTTRDGWISQVFTGSPEEAEKLKQQCGFEVSLFLELYGILLELWRPDVILRPLTNRFLRGSVQLIGRVVSFIADGMEGKIKFGEETPVPVNGTSSGENKSDDVTNGIPPPAFPTRAPYNWGESEVDVAAVAWELTILESVVRHDYVSTVCESVTDDDCSESDGAEIRSLVTDVLKEASGQIPPLVDKAWNDIVVNILTKKCSNPLAAVKGVAATYRMTNRPPPTQASPFVATILRPLKEFNKDFENRTPDRIGARWKQQIVVTVSERYASAVEELLATVQRTEAALQGRRARRVVAGGMSDGEKVKLQLFLDVQTFSQSVHDIGVDPATVIGLSKLKELTVEGEKLQQRNQNGN